MDTCRSGHEPRSGGLVRSGESRVHLQTRERHLHDRRKRGRGVEKRGHQSARLPPNR